MTHERGNATVVEVSFNAATAEADIANFTRGISSEHLQQFRDLLVGLRKLFVVDSTRVGNSVTLTLNDEQKAAYKNQVKGMILRSSAIFHPYERATVLEPFEKWCLAGLDDLPTALYNAIITESIK